MEAAPPTQTQDSSNSPSRPFRGLLGDSHALLGTAATDLQPCSIRGRHDLACSLLASFSAGLDALFPSNPYRPRIARQCLLLHRLFAGHSHAALIPWRRLETSTMGLWLVGTLLAIVFENYWIADEIYPFVN
jgi:hypothetical protein